MSLESTVEKTRDYMTANRAADLFSAAFRRLGSGTLLSLPVGLWDLLESGDGLWNESPVSVDHKPALGTWNGAVLLEPTERFINLVSAIWAVKADHPIFTSYHPERAPIACAE